MDEPIVSEPRRSGIFFSPAELRAQVEDYIAQCAEADIFPDLAGMRLFLGLSRQDLESLEKSPEGKNVLDFAADCRESWLVRQMIGDKNKSSACYNALKESCNGGWSDRDKGGRGRMRIEFSGNIGPEDFM